MYLIVSVSALSVERWHRAIVDLPHTRVFAAAVDFGCGYFPRSLAFHPSVQNLAFCNGRAILFPPNARIHLYNFLTNNSELDLMIKALASMA